MSSGSSSSDPKTVKGHHPMQMSQGGKGHHKQKSSIHLIMQQQEAAKAKTEEVKKQLDQMSPEERERRNKHIKITDTDGVQAPWVRAQIKAFTGWANNFLPHRRLEEANFATQMADGIVAIELLAALDGKVFKSYHKKCINQYQAFENWELVLKSLKESGLYVGAQDPYVLSDPKRNVKMLLGLVWQTILKFGLRPKKTGIADKLRKRADGSAMTATSGTTETAEVSTSAEHANNMFTELKNWCNGKLAQSEGRDSSVTVNDFTKSFENGLVFCHLLNAMKPGVVNVKHLNPDQGIQNLNTAFSLAYQHLGIPELLIADPALLDAHSVMTYVSLWRLKDLAPDEIRHISSPRAEKAEVVVPVTFAELPKGKWQTCNENGQRCACSEIAHPDVGPLTLDLKHEPGQTRLLCNCGFSSTFPNCDKKMCSQLNASTGSSWTGFVANRSELGDSVVFCACGHSKSRNIGVPICDGSCRRLVDLESGLTGTLHQRKDSHGSLDLMHPLVSKLIQGQHFLAFSADVPHMFDTFAWFNPRDGACGTLHWSHGTASNHDTTPFRSLPVDQITDVLLGKQTQVLQTYAAQFSEKECFSIVGMEATMDLKADSETALLGWLDAFEHILRHFGKMIEGDEADVTAATVVATSPSSSSQEIQGHTLSFNARDLISGVGLTAAPSAMVSVYCKNPETARYEWVGETEVIVNNRNPEFTSKIFVPNKYQDQWVTIAVNGVDQSRLVSSNANGNTGTLGETTVRMSELINPNNTNKPQTLPLSSDTPAITQQLKENSSSIVVVARPTNAGFTSLDASRSPLHKNTGLEKASSGYAAIMGYDGDGGENADSKRVGVSGANLKRGKESNGNVAIEESALAKKLYKGQVFKIYEQQRDKPVKREAFVFFSPTGGQLGSLYWCQPGTRVESPNFWLPLHTITDVYIGKHVKHSPIWASAIAKDASDKTCFSIVGKRVTLNLEAGTKQDVSDWMKGINHIMTTAGKRKAKKNRIGGPVQIDDYDVMQTTVFEATATGSLEGLEAVLMSGDNISGAVDFSLFQAVVDHNVLKTAALLLFRANPRSTDDGQTPLHRALMWSELSSPKKLEPIIRLLVAAGAVVEALDLEGQRASDYLTLQQQEALRGAFSENRSLAAVARSYGYEKPQQEEWL